MRNDPRGRAAQVAGRARAATPEAAEARARGNAVSARLRAGDREWGRRMAFQRALKRGEMPVDPMKKIRELERRLAAIEARQ